jgi:hypothetical protein
MVPDAHLSGLQIYSGNFGTNQCGEMACAFKKSLTGTGFSQWGIGRLSTGWEASMSQGSVLFDALYSAF